MLLSLEPVVRMEIERNVEVHLEWPCPHLENTMLLGATWRLDSVIGCWVCNLLRNN